MPMIVQRVSTADAQGTRWRATPNAHSGKDQTIAISSQKNRQRKKTSQEWLSFTPVNRISFRALQTACSAPHGHAGLNVGSGREPQGHVKSTILAAPWLTNGSAASHTARWWVNRST